MNSIHRPRSRPRVRSVNFRSLWWLVHRVACWRIVYGDVEPRRAGQVAVRFVKRERYMVDAHARELLERDDWRRVQP